MARKQVVTIEGLDKVVRELQKRGLNVQQGLEAICHAGAAPILDDAKQRAPGSLGDVLEKQTTAMKAAKVEVSVGPTKRKKVAMHVEWGTEGHEITVRPKRGKKALAVPGFGVFRRVQHPGAKKNPFMRPAYQAKKGEAQTEISAATKKAIGA